MFHFGLNLFAYLKHGLELRTFNKFMFIRLYKVPVSTQLFLLNKFASREKSFIWYKVLFCVSSLTQKWMNQMT